jgi:hypothetical protein
MRTGNHCRSSVPGPALAEAARSLQAAPAARREATLALLCLLSGLNAVALALNLSQPSRAAVHGMSYQDLLRDPDFTRAVKTITEQCSVNVDIAKLNVPGGMSLHRSHHPAACLLHVSGWLPFGSPRRAAALRQRNITYRDREAPTRHHPSHRHVGILTEKFQAA